MNRIGIKIDLDTGDLVSGAARGRQAIADLDKEINKARKEDRFDDFEKLSHQRDMLQARASGFERDIKTLANDPRLQTRAADGSVVLKLDPEYESLIKKQNEEARKTADELLEARRSGDTGKIQSLAPLLEGKLYESQKTIRDIINTGGDFSKRPVVGNIPGPQGAKPEQPFPQNGDWRELKGLSGAITQQHDVGNWEQVSRLGNNKDALRGIMGEYDRDSRLEAKIKADPEFASQLKEIRDALKGTIAAIDEAAANGEYEKVDQLTGQAKQLQGISHKTVQEAAALPDSKTARDAALSSFLNVQTAQQMVGAVTSGINTYVAHLDRSSIVNAMGGGDVMGAQIEELHRSAAEKSALWGSVGRIGGGILGGVIGTFINPGIGTAAGAAIGSTLLGAGGDLVGTLGDEKKANEMATGEAYSKLWERQAPAAMELTGLLGKYGGSTEENTRSIRRTFENAANAATEYGFSPEEGMEQVKQAAYQGLNERQALGAARDVFAFERGTGADKGVLAEFRSRTERFGGVSDGLNTAWRGSQASGMSPAQFNEYLRSMQKTFEDGISKGFVRGADEIAGNFSFLSDLNGGSELWKGEQGANRLSQMNAGVAATTGLASASDILSFRGAQNLLKQWDAEARWAAIGDLDPKKNGLELRRGYDYIDPMAILERGLTPELFHSQMQIIEGVEGKGNRVGAVEQMKNIYDLNYTGAAVLYQNYQDKREELRREGKSEEEYFNSSEWKEQLKAFQDNPEYKSKESLMLSYTADIQKYTEQIGQWHLDNKLPELFESLRTSWLEAVKKGVTSDRGPGEHAPPGGAPPPNPPPEPVKPIVPPSEVEETLEDLERVATNPSSTGDDIRHVRNIAIEAQVEEGRRRAEIKKMLKKDAVVGGKRSTFFTDTWDGFGKDDPDEAAYKNLQTFGNELKGTDAYDNYWKSMDILGTFNNEERQYVNNNNSINTAVNDAMTDKTGQRLVELLTELRDNTKELHLEERP